MKWFKSLSTGKKAAVVIGALVLVFIVGYFFFNRTKRNNALAAAAEKAKRGQGLEKWSGRPATQDEWNRFDGALRDALGGVEKATDNDYSKALGFLKGLGLSWSTISYFKTEIADYVNANGDGDEFVTAGQYL